MHKAAPFAATLKEANAHDRLGLIQAFVEAAADVTAMADLRTLLDYAVSEIGFQHYAIIHHVCFGRPSENNVRLTNYPLEWVGHFREETKLVDPVLRAAERMSSGFKWEQLDSIVSLTPADRAHLGRAAEQGLHQGYTVPNHVPGEAFGSCHFAIRGTDDFPDGSLPAAQALGNFAFEAARRLIRQRPGEIYLKPAPLSDRQRECLRFVARGKSDSVIAQLVGIRPRTVNEHIEAAKRRYSVATRSQLLVRALFSSEICFSEVID